MSSCSVIRFIAALTFGCLWSGSAVAQRTPPPINPELRTGTTPLQGAEARRLRQVTQSPIQVVVRLSDPPLAAVARNPTTGVRLTRAQQIAYVQQLQQKQTALMNQIAGQGGTEIARLTKASNSLIVSIDRTRAASIRALQGVVSVQGVVNYQRALSTVAPYVGATAVQNLGITGRNVRVAVLDSGVDYTHRNLGGPGTVAAFTAAYGSSAAAPQNKVRGNLFPTAKVVDGFDFVGEVWPTGPLEPDPDPIDIEGHGTHVADIIGGKSTDGSHKGIAPDASLLAVKVCSAIATPCSGVALLQGMEFALDPNGDFDVSDAVEVINLSLGSDFGQREDDLTEAARIVSRFGVVIVAAAGNGGNIPFVAGSPANGPSVISVAQTEVPTALNYGLQINSPPAIAGIYRDTVLLDYAPLGSGFGNAPVVFVGRGCPAEGTAPADPYLANPAGKVALIDRGACNVSLKVDRAAKAGAIGVLIGLIAPGSAIGFSRGGGDRFVPSLVITQAVSNLIKGQLGNGQTVRVTLSPNTALPLVGSMVSSSARGPGYSYGSIKPDLGAPGASVSANAGTGDEESAFGGTSGASPVVAGAAALLLQACPVCTPVDIKARLMNTANPNITTNPAIDPAGLAPISRIGSGEVRVLAALNVKTEAWDAGDPESVSLSLGGFRLSSSRTLQKKVLVRNLSNAQRTYSISTSFRYASDAALGAVTLSAPPSITVPGNGSQTFIFTVAVNPLALPPWNFNGGPDGGNGSLLDGLEFDGYVRISDASDTIRLPWQVLPHAAARVQPSTTSLALAGGTRTFSLTNAGGAVPGNFDVFSLTGVSPQLPAGVLPLPGDNYAIVDLRYTGFRLVNLGGGQFAGQFAVNTFGERSHPSTPAEFDVYLDTNADGKVDFVVFNIDLGSFLGVEPNGTNVVAIQQYDAAGSPVGPANAYFFTDTDLSTSNAILTVPLAALQITPATKLNYSVYAFDNYFTGQLTDAIPGITYTPGTPKFVSNVSSGVVPVGGSVNLAVQAVPGGAIASPSQSGLLLLYRDALSGQEASAVAVTP